MEKLAQNGQLGFPRKGGVDFQAQFGVDRFGKADERDGQSGDVFLSEIAFFLFLGQSSRVLVMGRFAFFRRGRGRMFGSGCARHHSRFEMKRMLCGCRFRSVMVQILAWVRENRQREFRG